MAQPEGYVLLRHLLPEAIKKLEGRGRLIAPTASGQQEVVFDQVDTVEQICWDYGNTLESPVNWLFLPTEQIFEFDLTEGRPQLQRPSPPPCQVLVAVRPCDATAISYLDRFFLEGDYKDELYARRREKTVVIALGCEEPASPNCFCSCCQGGPVPEAGYDVLLSPVGERILVEAGSPVGEEIIESWSELLQPADEEFIAARDAQAKAVMEQMESQGQVTAAMRRVSAGAVPEEVWADIGRHCLDCGGCSYVCPMCTCFAVVDILTEPGKGQRMRTTDSCRHEAYAQEASGANPRPTSAGRAERYAYHKLSHAYMLQNDRPGCVGCGRCISVCLGAVDMPVVLRKIREESPGGRHVSPTSGTD